ncbi:peptide-methionine (S)-S-oxide reductase MsrA [Marinibaculum pumilum]|uniref:Peptide methionine sulfoxide reductase MsrA n=1 Tax=Marinibaculum pumilum TaxID=1766165 RepID=A0ABV7KZQ0_9PROT
MFGRGESGGLCVLPHEVPAPEMDWAPDAKLASAVLAGGCFWCTEAVFKRLDGVIDVKPGYAGGTAETADYQTVCSGRTGHAEAIRVDYDPTRISYGRLLQVFFSVAHDPTQLDRQGNDVGPQYRSAIFWASEEEKEVAAAYIRQLDEAQVFESRIVTRLEPLQAFYEAEDYHHDYADRNPMQPYIAFISMPKVKKLQQSFSDWLKGGG